MKRNSRKSLRQDQILAALNLDPALRVNQLAETLDVSTETVRRDLAELGNSGKIKRTYGGAVRTQRFEPALSERLQLKVHERQSIAQRTVDRLRGVEAVLIGGGATTLHFARALGNIEHPITVITAAYSVAVELSLNPLVEVLCLPGTYDGRESIVYGPEAINAIERFHLPVAVIGASGINKDGVSEALLGPGQVYQAIISNADSVFILADSSKFNKRALTLLSDWRPNFTLVTDSEPEGELRAALINGGVCIEVAECFRGAPTQISRES